MKRLNYLILLSLSYAICHADNNRTQSSWFDYTKESAAKAFDATKSATKSGVEETGKFLNKTGKATKKGFEAFKDSFDANNANPDSQNNAYIKVDGSKYCLSIKTVDNKDQFCLAQFRPAVCDKSVFEILKKLKSPSPC